MIRRPTGGFCLSLSPDERPTARLSGRPRVGVAFRLTGAGPMDEVQKGLRPRGDKVSPTSHPRRRRAGDSSTGGSTI